LILRKSLNLKSLSRAIFRIPLSPPWIALMA
jgi:hypothetical protein